jgi:acyl-CoA thioesterase FadM
MVERSAEKPTLARVEIELPQTFPFTTEIPIRIGDVNYGGHLGNDAVLSLAHEARVRLFARHGWTEMDVGGPGIIMVDAAVVYRAEGAWGMTLRVDVAVADLRTRGCDLVYRLSDSTSGKEIARAKTGIVFFDYAARRIVHVPEPFRTTFGEHHRT